MDSEHRNRGQNTSKGSKRPEGADSCARARAETRSTQPNRSGGRGPQSPHPRGPRRGAASHNGNRAHLEAQLALSANYWEGPTVLTFLPTERTPPRRADGHEQPVARTPPPGRTRSLTEPRRPQAAKNPLQPASVSHTDTNSGDLPRPLQLPGATSTEASRQKTPRSVTHTPPGERRPALAPWLARGREEAGRTRGRGARALGSETDSVPARPFKAGTLSELTQRRVPASSPSARKTQCPASRAAGGLGAVPHGSGGHWEPDAFGSSADSSRDP